MSSGKLDAWGTAHSDSVFVAGVSRAIRPTLYSVKKTLPEKSRRNAPGLVPPGSVQRVKSLVAESTRMTVFDGPPANGGVVKYARPSPSAAIPSVAVLTDGDTHSVSTLVN